VQHRHKLQGDIDIYKRPSSFPSGKELHAAGWRIELAGGRYCIVGPGDELIVDCDSESLAKALFPALVTCWFVGYGHGTDDST
jgi:hypothetical protein